MLKAPLIVAMLLLAAAPLAACDHSQGGGGGTEQVKSRDLPESNDVNPSLKPDSYIDKASKQKSDAEKQKNPT